MLLSTLAASLLGSALASRGILRGGNEVSRAGEGMIRADKDF